MIDGLNGNAVPGIVIAALALIGVIYQARVGVRPADQAGFRADFEAVVKGLREDNAELKAQNAALDSKIGVLEAKIDEQKIETLALAGYTRDLMYELRRNNLAIPAYAPPPNLEKHLR
jgi:hypothetical protein